MIKRILLSVLLLPALMVSAKQEAVPADEILTYVRGRLPSDPITLSGTLKVRTRKGFTQSSRPVSMRLDWGAHPPTASYRIGDPGGDGFQSLKITWKNNKPSYSFSDPASTPTSEILNTGINWADLSFSVLWWPNSKLVDEGKKIGRECYVVEVPVPDSDTSMRLWIEKKMGMLLEAHTLNAKGKETRRMRIRSIKKMDGMWVAKDLEITDKASGNKTTLQITDLNWEKSRIPGLNESAEITAHPLPELSEEFAATTAVAFDLTGSINRFSTDLYKNLASGDEGNIFCSPASISTALAMTYAGARGDTAAQMNNALHFNGQSVTHPAFSAFSKQLKEIQKKGDVELSLANSLWPQEDYSFQQDYLALTKEFYGSEIESVNYKTDTEGARLKINGWVEDQTNDKIKNLIPDGVLDSLTRLVLANAIYFKGDWGHQFDKEHTRPSPFTLADGSTVEVPMMSQTEKFNFARQETFQALELPYKGDDLSMLILLPRTADGLPELEKKLTPELIEELKLQKTKVMVQFPRFKLESSFGLSETLKAMGMPLAFSEKADFSGMDGTQNLFISAVLHKAFVEVNEEGTEAAAATGIVVSRTGIPPMFTANHPFLFMIRENNTGAILFIGRVMNPEDA